MITRIGLPRIITLSGALLMVILGLALSRVTGDRERSSAARAVGPAGPPPVSLGVLTPPPASESAAEPAPAEANPAAEEVDRPETPAPKPENLAPPAAPVSSAARPAAAPAARPKPAPKVSSTRGLPPLPPPDWSMEEAPAEPTGPPPGVLWLSGVIQGEPRVALLRRGDSRFVVKEGDIIEDRYTVSQIGSNNVVLKYGSRKLTLRVGQY